MEDFERLSLTKEDKEDIVIDDEERGKEFEECALGFFRKFLTMRSFNHRATKNAMYMNALKWQQRHFTKMCK